MGRTYARLVEVSCRGCECQEMSGRRIQESKCGDPFPLCSDNVDVIDVLRCLNCDALFERGRFVLFWGEVRADQLK